MSKFITDTNKTSLERTDGKQVSPTTMVQLTTSDLEQRIAQGKAWGYTREEAADLVEEAIGTWQKYNQSILDEASRPKPGELQLKDEDEHHLIVPNDGYSPFAIRTPKEWDDKDRPLAWQGAVYGLVVHTTGRGLPEKAEAAGQYPTTRAVNYYSKSHGTHYVLGYRGIAGGDLIQMANEREQANGVGTLDQRKSLHKGWTRDLPPALVKRWRQRWPGYANPLDLLPGTKTANPAYIHLECTPLTHHFMDSLDLEPNMERQLFTYEQYESIAALACDIAVRNDWPDEWWLTPRLLGHEDLSPVTRHNKQGAWDPGFLRATPAFDWPVVQELILDIVGHKNGGSFSDYTPKLPKPVGRRKGHYENY